MKLMILNGANINLLGVREPDIYGREDYATLLSRVCDHAEELGVEVECCQSNHEGVGLPTVEVHISAVEKREDFRQVSYLRAVAVHTITGQGIAGYTQAMDYLVEHYGKEK